MKNRYRIVEGPNYFSDTVFDVEVKYWFFPFFWFHVGSKLNYEAAVRFAELHKKNRKIYYLP